MPLDLTSLRNAVLSLSESVAVAENEAFMRRLTEAEHRVVRAGVIQNFEVAYTVCCRDMDRWLGANVASDSVLGATRRQRFRLAARNRLIHDVGAWMAYHETRNLTSHTYNAERTMLAYEAVRGFLHDAQYLLGALEARND
ncbi:nucleotidyltransferase substrate binding protein [Candidatus Poriferisodalis sp.]|uniref:nucleotidyltransferase substrate binding protein n=1 Tax=Candidatus Poriferisodalis sp. TaxID=3101277 RepID=UPI003B01D819